MCIWCVILNLAAIYPLRIVHAVSELHRGYTEEEAKQMVQEAVEERNANQPEESGLFGEE